MRESFNQLSFCVAVGRMLLWILAISCFARLASLSSSTLLSSSSPSFYSLFLSLHFPPLSSSTRPQTSSLPLSSRSKTGQPTTLFAFTFSSLYSSSPFKSSTLHLSKDANFAFRRFPLSTPPFRLRNRRTSFLSTSLSRSRSTYRRKRQRHISHLSDFTFRFSIFEFGTVYSPSPPTRLGRIDER